MRDFYRILGNTLFASVANFFVWFALTFWLYLQTQSVLATSLLGGAYLVITSISGIWFGSLVDHRKKKHAMMLSSAGTALSFGAALAFYALTPEDAFKSVAEPRLWLLVFLVLLGVTAGNIRGIALPTLTTVLIPDAERRERANGLSGMVMGVSSSGAGLTSGLALAYLGMFWILAIGVGCALLALLHLAWVSISEPAPVAAADGKEHVDVRGTIRVVREIPGLFPLIFFMSLNNFIAGVFMALMDAYGLSLLSVQAWGTLWGVLSTGFIVGGLYVAKRGLGPKPLRRLFLANLGIWTSSMLFTMQPSVVLLSAGIVVWVLLSPSIEAAEQSVVQKVVPVERQGRVFGFSQSLELAASPLSAFLVGPLTQFILIPFMTTGKGPELIGSWFGTGAARGMALAFIGAGAIGLLMTLWAMRSRSYRLLSDRYNAAAARLPAMGPNVQVDES